MRQLTTILLLIFTVTIISAERGYCAIKGGVSNSIPVYYDNLSESELLEKGKIYFHNSMLLKPREINDDMTQALNIYTMLQNVNPENTYYPVALGRLYDKLGKDRYAKGGFSRAIAINPSKPEPYFYFGEYYYSRNMYRKALKYYNEAYKNGFETNYDLLYKIGDVYEKLGDTRSALKYLKDAEKQSSNSELSAKIKRVEAENSVNGVYNRDTRIRIAQ